MASSFAVTCLIYIPLVVWAVVGMPNMAFKAAGQEATVSLSFAQISGGAPAAVAQPQPQVQEPEPEPEPEVVPEPEPEKEEVKPEPQEEPAIVKKEPPKKKVVEQKPKPKKEKPKKKPEKPKEAVKPQPQPKPAEEAPAEQTPAPAQQSLAPAAVPTASQGAPTAGSQGGISTLVYGQVEDPFLAEVKRQVEAALHYPRKARAMRMQGVATVQFIVANDGTLTELEIHSSSGHGLLDKMAIKAVEAAQPRWGQPNRTVRLRFPIQFRLSN